MAARKKVATKSNVSAPKLSAVSAPYSKTQILGEIAERTSLSKRQVSSVFDELGTLINRHIKKRGAGTFTLPGLLKITTVKKPARKARKGINPFTGEETVFAAKPASTQVKIRPLKALKDMTAN
jgi:nucleoid DNA-binding protein